MKKEWTNQSVSVGQVSKGFHRHCWGKPSILRMFINHGWCNFVTKMLSKFFHRIVEVKVTL